MHLAVAPETPNRPRVLVQPLDGVGPVRALMDGARASIKVKMFAFSSPALLEGLIAAKARGVDVRVMLNPARSSGSRANDEASEQLKAAGVAVLWTNPRFAVTHEKSMVVDRTTALIATFNFSDKYFTHTRDYGLIITDPAIVGEVETGFEADWHRTAFNPPFGSVLLWSNFNARQAIAAFIDDARHSLIVQHPKFSDGAILDRLLAAHARSVHVRILCGGRHGISESDMSDTFSALRILIRAGIKVHKQRKLRLHAKLIVADHSRALVGSMNIDRSAFDLRRELGIVLDDEHAVATLRHQVNADWDESHPYEPSDPVAVHIHNEGDEPAMPELDHE
jgi:phosphatidylserine/phosphatidylglycerophosphate/cardiolipin synthase-like enzyme